MNTIDLITILGNISQSLYPVQKLITGGAYILGVLFFLTAMQVKNRGSSGQSSSQEKMFTPMMYLLVGALLIYLPSGMDLMANTAFGVGNVLTYSNYNPANIYSSMGFLIRTAGVLWFIRGCVLVAHSSQPGTQQGLKGLVFLIAGVFAMNFDNTIAMINSALDYFVKATLSVKAAAGF